MEEEEENNKEESEEILTSTVIPGRSCTEIGSDLPGR